MKRFMLKTPLRQAQGVIASVLLLILVAVGSSGQSVVNQLENVKKPGFGKLYFSKKDSSVYVWKGRWSKIVQETVFGSAQPPVVVPPVVVPPVLPPPTPPFQEGSGLLQEIPLGYWEVSDRVLVAKLLDGKYHLMQTNPSRSYYVPRGKNLLSDYRTKINSDVLTGDLLPSLVSVNSDIGGLATPSSFKDGVMTAKGFVKNAAGEWVLRQAQDGNVVLPPPTPPYQGGEPVLELIKVPVGVIFWDNWERDYWNDANPRYDPLINHITLNRLAVTEWKYKYELLPFYGQYHAPEKVKIRYNVRWSQADGRNLYDEREAMVEAKFDKTAADTEREVKYYRDAGFDWICFNYYNTDSYLSNARLQFVAMPNKMGMKMTFMVASNRSSDEIDYITGLMTQEYWFRIDGKPVLYLESHHFSDLPKYRASLATKGINDIYVVYFAPDGYPGDWTDIQSKRCNAVSAYMTSSTNHSAEALLIDEVNNRENWMGQFKATHVSLIPTITTGLENLQKRTSLATEQAGYVEGATLEQIDRKNKMVGEFVKKYPTKVPAILWYAGNELLECGEMSLVPKRRKNETIDTSVLDTIRRRLE